MEGATAEAFVDDDDDDDDEASAAGSFLCSQKKKKKTMASMLRLQLERVHKRLERVSSELASERSERWQLEAEVEQLRAAEELSSSATPASRARQLVEDAIAKAVASKEECERLRADLEAEREARAEADARTSDAASLRRALHNLSTSFEEQEHSLKTSLDDSAAELERHRQTRLRCAKTTQRLAETLRELMLDLALEDDLDDTKYNGSTLSESTLPDDNDDRHHHRLQDGGATLDDR